MNGPTIAADAIAARVRTRIVRARITRSISASGFVLVMLIAGFFTESNRAVAQTCVGDCNGDGAVRIDELVLAVNIALGVAPLSECSNLDNGQGMVSIDRLVAAVNSALCDCQPCAAATPTPTGEPTPNPTPLESMWHVDDYQINDSDCAGPIESAVLNGLVSEYTVRQFDDGRVEIDDGHGGTFEGTADPDGTVHVTTTQRGSIGPCDTRVDVDASADLSQSPTTATYDAAVNLSGLCLGISDCSLRITSRWMRLDSATFESGGHAP